MAVVGIGRTTGDHNGTCVHVLTNRGRTACGIRPDFTRRKNVVLTSIGIRIANRIHTVFTVGHCDVCKIKRDVTRVANVINPIHLTANRNVRPRTGIGIGTVRGFLDFDIGHRRTANVKRHVHEVIRSDATAERCVQQSHSVRRRQHVITRRIRRGDV